MRMRPGLGVLIACCIVLSVGYGVRQCLGLFIGPMEAARGWGAGVFSLGFALQNLVWGIAQPFAGAIADRFGAKRTVMVGGLCYAAAIVLMATTRNPTLFSWGSGILLGLALAATSFGILIGPAATLVPPEKRTVALGILGAGGSLGQLFYPPFAQVAIGGIGWHTTLLILVAIGLAIVPLALLLTEPPRVQHGAASLSLGAALREALRVPSFGLLTAGFFVCGFHIAFFQTHLPAIVARAGFAPSIGAAALAVVGGFNVFGSYYSGKISQKIAKRYVLAGIYGLRAVAIVLFIALPISPATIIGFSAALGVLWLSTIPPTSGIIAEKFGMQWVSTLFGVAFFSHQVGAFFGAWLGGIILERTGSYQLMWYVALGVAIVGMLIQLPIDERPVERLAAKPA